MFLAHDQIVTRVVVYVTAGFLKYCEYSVRTSEFKSVASHSLPLVVNKESLIVPVRRAGVMMSLATKCVQVTKFGKGPAERHIR